jgi:hypothetical protein
MRMDNWLGKLFRHPTGSNFIGGLGVAAVLGALGAIAKWWAQIAAAVLAIWNWLGSSAHSIAAWWSAPITLPRHSLIGWLLLVAVIGLVVGALLARWASKAVQHMQQQAMPPSKAIASSPPNSIDSATLTETDAQILAFVASYDGAIVQLATIQASFGWGHLITQRHVERLLIGGLLEHSSMSNDIFVRTGPSSVRLSRQGVEMSVQQRWLPA